MRGKLSPLLQPRQQRFRQTPLPERLSQQVCRRHRILDGQIYSYATRRGHGMRSVADTEQARKMPFPQPVDLHRQQFNLIPAFEFVHAISQIWRNSPNRLAKRGDSFALGLLERTLRNNKSGLKIVAAVDQDQRPAVVEISQQLLRIAPRCEMRNHSTSIGTPNSCTRRPAALRMVECRPSHATTRSAWMCTGPSGDRASTPAIL